MQRWADAERVLVELAELELAGRELAEGSETVTPCLMAFAGEQLRFTAFLREFDKGAYHSPMIELLALATPLDADRLAFAISGRAWSLRDPIAPVTDDVDLRQRVLCIELVDGTRGRPQRTSVLLPFDLLPLLPGASAEPGPPGTLGPLQRPVWGERQALPGGEGWIGSALALAVSTRARRRMRAPDAEIARQARRVGLLGHELYLEEALAERLVRAAPFPGARAGFHGEVQDGRP